MKACPYCAEQIQDEAIVCRYCGRDLSDAAVMPVPPATPAAASSIVRTTTNGFAVASLVLGIVWMSGLGSVLALVFGYKGKSEIDRSEGTQSGRGLAVAGIVLGWIGVSVIALGIVIVVATAFLGSAASSQFSQVGSQINHP